MSSRVTARPLDQQASDAAYDRWAPIYDLIFNLPFHPGRLAAARPRRGRAARSGEILVVGVGTGLELACCRRRRASPASTSAAPCSTSRASAVRRKKLRQVKALREMDARALDLPDASFDVALAPYVMSVVPDPARALDEMWRVVRPGGELVADQPFRGANSGWRVGVESGDGRRCGLARLASEVSRSPPSATGSPRGPQARLDRATGAAAAQDVHAAEDRQGCVSAEAPGPVRPRDGARSQPRRARILRQSPSRLGVLRASACNSPSARATRRGRRPSALSSSEL